MIPEFREFAERAEVLFSDLEAAPLRPFKALASDKNVPGIYVFYEDGTPVYVGRTRNLQGRLRAHVTRSHNSASFAFKRTREAHSLGATYKPNMSRDAISTREPYKSTFLAEIEKINHSAIPPADAVCAKRRMISSAQFKLAH